MLAGHRYICNGMIKRQSWKTGKLKNDTSEKGELNNDISEQGNLKNVILEIWTGYFWHRRNEKGQIWKVNLWKGQFCKQSRKGQFWKRVILEGDKIKKGSSENESNYSGRRTPHVYRFLLITVRFVNATWVIIELLASGNIVKGGESMSSGGWVSGV